MIISSTKISIGKIQAQIHTRCAARRGSGTEKSMVKEMVKEIKAARGKAIPDSIFCRLSGFGFDFFQVFIQLVECDFTINVIHVHAHRLHPLNTLFHNVFQR